MSASDYLVGQKNVASWTRIKNFATAREEVVVGADLAFFRLGVRWPRFMIGAAIGCSILFPPLQPLAMRAFKFLASPNILGIIFIVEFLFLSLSAVLRTEVWAGFFLDLAKKSIECNTGRAARYGSFLAGLSAVAIVHSAATWTTGGVRLALLGCLCLVLPLLGYQYLAQLWLSDERLCRNRNAGACVLGGIALCCVVIPILSRAS